MYIKTINEHIDYLDSILNDNNRSILVYKGFPNDFTKELCGEIPPMFGSLYYFDGNKINLNKIQDNIKSLVSIFLDDKKKTAFLLYEEFIAISRNINLGLSEAKIYIIENNILNEVPNQSTCRFGDIEKEIENPAGITTSNSIFDYFYSYSTYYDQINYIQYQNIDISEFSNIKIVNYFDTLSYDKKILPKKIIMNGVIDNSYDFSSDIDLYKLVNLIFDSNLNELHEVNIIIDHSITKSKKKETLSIIKFIYEINGIIVNILRKSEDIDTDSVRPDFIEILKKNWKSNCFRDLIFYKNPDVNTEKKVISQGIIIEQICRQAEFATSEKEFSDIFITAPTGSGKSVLFQIPAIYLANKFNTITIVVSPLKALMYDQVVSLRENRGVNCVEYINSDISFIERERIVNSIKNGSVSILYLSPELLLSYDIKNFIGDRKIGLFVIDEAHLVTTWGRDFRVDYWYLGKYIRKLRKYNNYFFPVLALTATATYAGQNDIVFETIDSLNMKSPIIYIGNVRRDEIIFNINKFDYTGSHELAKIEKTRDKIEQNIENKVKTIVYFPWTNQINSIRYEISEEKREYVGEYFSTVDKYKKQTVIDNFASGKLLIVLATKAFGMGVDIGDIKEVYHHAVSGGIPDYIQEIGRVARTPSIKGLASTDFNIKDLKFSKILYGLSSIKQYQIKLILEKIWNIYSKIKKQNFLVSTDDFGYIFGNDAKDNIETKVKSAFLLLENDLLKKYNYSVLIVRPKSMFTQVFASVDKSIEKEFLLKYGQYVKEVSSQCTNKRTSTGKNQCVSSDPGNIYQISLNGIWENYFAELSFPMTKKLFFDRKLFDEFNNLVYPRYNLKISLIKPFDSVNKDIEEIFEKFEKIFEKLKNKYFTKQEFEAKIMEYFNDNLFKKRCSNLFLNLYTSRTDYFVENKRQYDDLSFIQAKRNDNGEEQYKIISNKFSKVIHRTCRDINDMFFDQNGLVYNKFLEVNEAIHEVPIRVAYLLETFSLGSYEIIGGKLPQIFVRINDPYKIKLLAQSNDKYENIILSDIDARHHESMKVMSDFFMSDMDNNDRWNFIEEYFLGK